MLTAPIRTAAITGLCLLAGGCGPAPSGDDEKILVAEQEIIVMNGDDPLFFWQPSTQQALRALARAPLGSSTGALADTPLLGSVEGQRLLGYVVACALSEGEALHGAASGDRLDGVVGLAAEWASAALDDIGSQRWVTACLLQTLNGLGARVPVRMSGSHPALADDPAAGDSEYSVPDATMFGNLFGSDGSSAFACADTAVQPCGASFSDRSLQRICGLSPTCGILGLGPCGLSCVRDAAGHATCNEPAGDTYVEAISTTLHRNGSISLSQSCGY
jgi:hypothetical protein